MQEKKNTPKKYYVMTFTIPQYKFESLVHNEVLLKRSTDCASMKKMYLLYSVVMFFTEKTITFNYITSSNNLWGMSSTFSELHLININ